MRHRHINYHLHIYKQMLNKMPKDLISSTCSVERQLNLCSTLQFFYRRSWSRYNWLQKIVRGEIIRKQHYIKIQSQIKDFSKVLPGMDKPEPALQKGLSLNGQGLHNSWFFQIHCGSCVLFISYWLVRDRFLQCSQTLYPNLSLVLLYKLKWQQLLILDILGASTFTIFFSLSL